MAARGTGGYPPKKTFGTGLKQTNRGGKMGKISATLSSQPRGAGIGASTSRVAK